MATIPDYRGVRAAVPNTYDPTRRAGSGGQRYFTDMEYVRGPQLDRLVDKRRMKLAIMRLWMQQWVGLILELLTRALL